MAHKYLYKITVSISVYKYLLTSLTIWIYSQPVITHITSHWIWLLSMVISSQHTTSFRSTFSILWVEKPIVTFQQILFWQIAVSRCYEDSCLLEVLSLLWPWDFTFFCCCWIQWFWVSFEEVSTQCYGLSNYNMEIEWNSSNQEKISFVNSIQYQISTALCSNPHNPKEGKQTIHGLKQNLILESPHNEISSSPHNYQNHTDI